MEKEKLISRHYRINDEIHISLMKIVTIKGNSISFHVRKALKQYINKNKSKTNGL